MDALLADLIVDHGNNKNDTEQDQCSCGGAALTVGFQCVVNEADHGVQTACVIGGTHVFAEDTDDAGVFFESTDKAGNDNVGQHGGKKGHGNVGKYSSAGGAVHLGRIVILPVNNLSGIQLSTLAISSQPFIRYAEYIVFSFVKEPYLLKVIPLSNTFAEDINSFVYGTLLSLPLTNMILGASG